MVKCEICGKSFKNKTALGGHMGNVHPRPKEESQGVSSQPVAVSEPPQQSVPTRPLPQAAISTETSTGEAVAPEDRDQAELIRELIADGYSLKQMVERFNLNYKTVWQEMRKHLKPEGSAEAKKQELLPAKIDDKRQQIIPEYLLQHFIGLDDGRALTPLEAVLLFQAARRSVMEDVTIYQGLVDAQAKATESQLKVLREAKSESSEVAIKAAEETAARVAAYFDQKKPDTTSTSSPLEGVFARLLESTLKNLMNKLFPGAAGEAPPGFVAEKRRKGE